jgi:hypothetical protein
MVAGVCSDYEWWMDNWTWMQHKVVDLKSFLPLSANLTSPSYIIAAADAVGVFVIWARGAGVLAIDVKSGLGRKLFHDNIINIIPYTSFCTPGN